MKEAAAGPAVFCPLLSPITTRATLTAYEQKGSKKGMKKGPSRSLAFLCRHVEIGGGGCSGGLLRSWGLCDSEGLANAVCRTSVGRGRICPRDLGWLRSTRCSIERDRRASLLRSFRGHGMNGLDP